MFKLDPNLRRYATDKQWEKLEALEKYGSETLAAKALGIKRANMWAARKAVEKKAAQYGYAPDHDLRNPVPDGFHVDGYSLLRDAQTGQAKLIWEKAKRSREDVVEAMRVGVEALCEDIVPAAPTEPPLSADNNLCNLYTISDFHMGMLAWHREGGHDWDIKIARDVLIGCFEKMINSAPNASVAVIGQLGDFLHSDGIIPVTPTSGHILDQDGRFSKIVGATIQCMRFVVDMALMRHKKVHLIIAEGNHDMSSSIWLRQMFSALYENEPRVTINNSELPYYSYQHGKTALFFHHGHMKKITQLPGLFAAQFPKIWGNTIYRYGHTGHLHHKIKMGEKEDMGITMIQHPTLSARDAYSSRRGFHSGRRALCYTYHSIYGEVGSNVVTPEMLE